MEDWQANRITPHKRGSVYRFLSIPDVVIPLDERQRSPLGPKQFWDVPRAVHDVKNKYVIFIVNSVQDHIVAGCEAAQAGSQIVTATADMRISSQQPEPVSDGVDDPVRAFEGPLSMATWSQMASNCDSASAERRCAINRTWDSVCGKCGLGRAA